MQFWVINKNSKRSWRLGYHGLCPVAFLMEFTSPWTWTLMLARTMRFSPYTEDLKLTLMQISERCRLTWHEHDQWKMTPPSWPVSSVTKAVRRTELPLSLSSVYFGWWFKIIVCRLHGSYFVVELKVQSTLFCFSVNSKLGRRLNYFCTGFCRSDCFAPSYGSFFVAVQYSQLVEFLHSHDRHASRSLVALPAF